MTLLRILALISQSTMRMVPPEWDRVDGRRVAGDN